MLEQKKRKRQKKTWKHIGAVVVSMMLVAALAVGVIPSESGSVRAESTVDLPTIDKYKESLGDNASTEYSGRVWTDKTVWDSDSVTIEAYGGKQHTITKSEADKDADFLVGFSALATAQEVYGQTEAPLDVVFVIDISGSMSNNGSTMDNGYSRIYNTLQALNAAIESLTALNEYTRIGVVSFSGDATTLLPLDRYTKYGNNEFFSVDRTAGSNQTTTLTVNAYGSDGEREYTTISVSGGTNIQKGLYQGLNLLATEDATTAMINNHSVQRIPSVVLLSDGAPTYSANTDSWWSIGNRDGNQGPGSSAYYGNGMLAMMTGAYMKDEVSRHYNVVDTPYETTLYSIGMGIEDLNDSNDRDDRNQYYLASVTLNPDANWDNTDSYATSIREAWDWYVNGKTTGGWRPQTTTTPSVEVNRDVDYTIEHPSTGYDIIDEKDENGEAIAIRKYVDRYYGADDAESISTIFGDIVSSLSINRPSAPTRYEAAEPLTSGYITYTDPIGDYMEIKDLKSIIYAGEIYTVKSVSKSGSDTDYVEKYIFEGQAGNEVYGINDLSNIIIEVATTVNEKDVKSQTLTVKIPAGMIPLRINTVKLDVNNNVTEHTNNGAYPIRVLYTVGLQDVVKGEGYIDTEKLSEEYLDDPTKVNADGTINFYSNLYTGQIVNGNTTGDATARFQAATTNSFYYMQEDVKIYKDQACTIPATTEAELEDATTYYYNEPYYHGMAVVDKVTERTGAQLKRNVDLIEIGGVWARPAGSVRTNRMLEFEGIKQFNHTATATEFYEPTFVQTGATPYDGEFVVHLGNNGKLTALAGGHLDIKKTVTADEGLTAPEKDFTFTVALRTAANEALTGTYNYDVLDSAGNAVLGADENLVVGTISDGGTITLKAGQTARILSLPPNSTYTVTETAVAGFTTTVEGEETLTATGTITAGETAEEAFNNHYAVEPVTFPAGSDLTGTKVLSGRDVDSELDKYTFLLTPYGNAPMPEDYDSANGVTVTLTNNATKSATFNFGQVNFTKPGVYRYTVVEKEPATAEDYLPGLTYSRAMYRMVITVIDNGNGTLSTNTDLQKLYTDDAQQLFAYEDGNIQMNPGEEAQDEIVFVNTYTVDSVQRVPISVKNYTDHSGVKPLRSGMFNFKLEPMGYSFDGGTTIVENTAANVPMPLDDNGDRLAVVTTTNEGPDVTFPAVTFEQKDISLGSSDSITFVYRFTEVVPEEATAENGYTFKGMTYDPTETFAYVTVSTEAGTDVLQVAVKYVTNGNEVRRPEFTNSYAQTPVTLSQEDDTALMVEKIFTGRTDNAWITDDAFTFVLEADLNDAATKAAFDADKIVMGEDNEKVSDTITISNTDELKTKMFSNITFKSEGTYVFKINEKAESIPGVTYDNTLYTVTVTVDDTNDDSVLEADVVYNNGTVDSAEDVAVFTNTYEAAPADPVTVSGSKEMTGRPLRAGQFYFEVIAQTGPTSGTRAALVSTTTDLEDADEDGIYEGTMNLLEGMIYDQAGTYVYIVHEQIPTAAVDNVLNGVTYDPTLYRITVTVTDNTEGKLVTATKIDKVAETAPGSGEYTVVAENAPIVYKNEYNTAPVVPTIYPAHKVLTGNRAEALKDGEFKFEVSVEGDKTGFTFGDYTEGMTLDNGPREATNKADGTIVPVNNIPITFIKPGDYSIVMKEKVPEGATEVDGKYVYEGVTYDTHTLTSTFRVRDDGLGNLVVNRIGTVGLTTFTNTYESEVTLDGETNLQVTKDFTGRDGNAWRENVDLFDFELTPYDAVTIAEFGQSITMAEGTDEAQITWADAEKKDAFGDITFTKHGTYKFMIREVKPAADATPGAIPGVSYDAVPRIVTVLVEDDSKGGMTATVTNIALEDGSVATLTFRNVFDRESDPLNGHNNLHVTKVLEGREWLTTDGFTFRIAAYNDLAKDNTKVSFDGATVITATSVNKDVVHFGNILFKHEGEYQFVVTEDVPTDKKGIDYDTTARLITVVAADEVDTTSTLDPKPVTLKARITKVETGTYTNGIFASTGEVADKSLTFTNTYDADEVTLDGNTYLEVTKNLVGRNWDINGVNDSFEFALTAYNDAAKDATLVTMPTKDEVTITSEDANYKEAFGDILFKEAGEYWFIVEEVVPAEADRAANLAYDTHKEIITVTVEDNLQGELVVTNVDYSYDNDLTWTNDYTPDAVTVSLQAKKSISGRQWREGDRFWFQLRAGETGNPMPATVYAAATGAYTDTVNNIVFGDITYTAEGTYIYYINEIGTYAGITNDTKTVKATVVVTNNKATGKFEADVSYEVLGSTIASGNVVEFVNTYNSTGSLEGSTNLKVTKNFTGRPNDAWLASDSFTFTLEADTAHAATKAALDAGKIVMPEGTLVVNAQNKETAAFGDIVFTQAGNFQFIVRETEGNLDGVTYDTSAKTVKVTVTDNWDGTLTAVVADGSDALTFNNTYSAEGIFEDFTVVKNLEGRKWRATDQFTFEIFADDATTMQAVQDGTIVLPDHDAATKALVEANKIALEANSTAITISGAKVADTEADVDALFGDITFKKAGVYKFKVREVKPLAVHAEEGGSVDIADLNVIPGVIYDNTVHEITVTVTDNHDATLSANVTAPTSVAEGNNIVFTNEYDPDKEPLNGHNNLQVHKTLTGRPNDEWLDSDKFTFTLEAYLADPVTETAIAAGKIATRVGTEYVTFATQTLEVTKENKALVHFDNIYFKDSPNVDYKFLMKEVIPAEATLNSEGNLEYKGIVYDESAYLITVNVREIVEGEDHILRATITAIQKGKMKDGNLDTTALTNVTVSEKAFAFANTYKADSVVLDGETNLKVTKNLVGRDWNTNDNFTFNLTSDEDYGSKVVMPEKDEVVITKEDANYQEAFGDITFTELGTYKFTISEAEIAEATDGSTLTINTDPVTVTVEVTDNGIGQLVATPSYEDDNTTLTFQNTYKPAPISVSLEGTKALLEPNGTAHTLKGGEFDFTVSRPEGSAASVPEVNGESATASNAASDVASDNKDGKVVFTNVVTFTEAGTYVYEIKETPGTDATIDYDDTTVTATIVVTYKEETGLLSAAAPTYSVADEDGGFKFTNTYKSRPATFSLNATKNVEVVNGLYEMKADDFEFVINRVGETANDPVADGTVVKNKADGTIAIFDNVVYQSEGTYTYTVTERNKQYAGFDYDESAYTVVVNVVYDKGQLVATSTVTKDGTAADFEFNNSYDVYKTTATIAGTKTLEGKPIVDGEFEFTLVPVSYTNVAGETTTETTAIPMPTESTVSNTGTGFTFGDITFTKDMIGTYKYQVVEVNKGANGVTYDSVAKDVTITVVKQDIGEGDELQKDAIVVTVDKTQDELVFTNTYVPNEVTLSGTTALQGTKKLTGRDMNVGEFTFTLTPVSYTDKDNHVTTDATAIPMPASATTKNEGTGKESGFAFDAITFDKVGTYTYTITEQKGALGGVTYDESSFGVVVEVSDDEHDGQLDAKVKYFEGESEAAVVFENTYSAAATSIVLDGMTKSLVGRDLFENEFEFVVTAKNYYTAVDGTPVEGAEIPLPETTTVTNGALGDVTRVNFGEIEFTKAGIYEYEISETNNNIEYIVYDTTKHVVKIEVTDNLEGELVARVIVPEAAAGGLDGIVFENRYEAPEVVFDKTQSINGVPAADVTKVVAGDIVTYTMTVTNIGKGMATGITVEDGTPVGLVFIEDSVEGGDSYVIGEDGIVTWTIHELKAGESKSVSFKALIPVVDEDTDWSNIASMHYENNPDNPKPDPENPDKPLDPEPIPSEEVEVFVRIPVITLVKEQQINDGESSEGSKAVAAGDKVTYTIKVTNSGTEDAENLVIRDLIPEGLILVEGSISGNGVLENGLITWNIGTLAIDETAVVSFTVEVPEVGDATNWKNIATATFDNNPDGPDEPVKSNEVDLTQSPKTGDSTNVFGFAGLAFAAVALGAVLTVSRRRRTR